MKNDDDDDGEEEEERWAGRSIDRWMGMTHELLLESHTVRP